MTATPAPDAGRSAVVHDLLRLLSNTRSVLGTPMQPWQGQRDAYLAWVDDAERRLRGLTDNDQAAGLHTDRYWKIRDLTEGSYRPAELVHAEIDAQHARLSAVVAGLPAPGGPDGSNPPGVRAVFDTNTHLHFPRFDQHGWVAELGGGPVTVVVPLLVLEELDAQKNKGAPVLGARAAAVVRRLQKAVEGDHGAVGADTTVLLLRDPDGHVRRPNNDDEIMDRAAALARTAGPQVVVVTDDGSMRARATTRGLPVHAPAAERLPATDPETIRLRKDVEKAREVLAARPDLKATFADGTARLMAPAVVPPPREREEWVAAMVRVAGERCPPAALKAKVTFRVIPLLSIGEVTEDDVREFNSEREAYLREIKEWVEREYQRRAVVLASVELPLAVLNPGGAAARDVELRVELVGPGARLAEASLRSAEEKPEQPSPPSPAIFRAVSAPPVALSRAVDRALAGADPEWDVALDGTSAVLVLPLVRHGGRPHPVPPLLLVPDERPGLASPVGLDWHLNGAEPPAHATGRLVVLARAPADEASMPHTGSG